MLYSPGLTLVPGIQGVLFNNRGPKRFCINGHPNQTDREMCNSAQNDPRTLGPLNHDVFSAKPFMPSIVWCMLFVSLVDGSVLFHLRTQTSLQAPEGGARQTPLTRWRGGVSRLTCLCQRRISPPAAVAISCASWLTAHAEIDVLCASSIPPARSRPFPLGFMR